MITSSSSKKDIQEFQLDLEELGIPLPRFGADGSLGSETRSAAHSASQRFNLPAPTRDEKLGEVYPTELVDGVNRLVSARKLAPATPGNFFDLTDVAYPGPREGRVPMSTFSGLTVHTTGAHPIGLKQWTQERRFKRWIDHSYINKRGVVVRDSLHAHIAITRHAEVLLVHPLDSFIWHGHGLSRFQWGLEIESFPYGELNNPKSLPSGGFDHAEATDEQIMAAREVIKWLDGQLFANTGRHMTTINPHRNSKNTRRSDPGEKIYKGVVKWAKDTMGLSDGGKGKTWGSGLPTPESWDEDYVGVDY